MSRFFSVDNPVWAAVDTFGKIIILNILWVICSIPVVTMGASTTALVYACLKLRNKEGYVIQNFFHSFKENFKQATVIWLIMLVIGAILAADMVLGNQSGTNFGNVMRIGAFVVAVPYAFVLLYVFPVLSKFVNSVKQTFKYAFGLSIQNWKQTILMLLLNVFVVWANTTIFLINYLMLVFGFASVAYICASYFERIFEPYIAARMGSSASDSEELSEILTDVELPEKAE